MPVEQLIRELTWGKCGEEPRALQGWPRQAFVSGVRRAVPPPPPPQPLLVTVRPRYNAARWALQAVLSLTLCGPTAKSSSAGALLPFCVPSPGSSVFCCRGGTGGAAWAPWPGGNRPHRGTVGAPLEPPVVDLAGPPSSPGGRAASAPGSGAYGSVVGPWPRSVSPAQQPSCLLWPCTVPAAVLSAVCLGREGTSRDARPWPC